MIAAPGLLDFPSARTGLPLSPEVFMRKGARLALGLSLLLAAAPGAAAQQARRNVITGHVFGESRLPLSDVFVELLDDLGVTVNRTRTNSSGRYEFASLPEGRFKVRVLPYGTDYAEQVQEVVVANFSALGGGSGGEIQQRDFYLRLRANLNAGPFAAPGTVFAQEVPEAARKLYERGVAELRAKKEREGFESLKGALAAFPDYFAALDRLGTEYAVRGGSNPAYYEAARVLLTKAVGVNPGSYSSTFGLAFAQYHLGMNGEAVQNFQRAVRLHDKSVNGHLWLGVALKKAGKLQQAEVSLKRANKLGEGKVPEVHMRLAEVYGDQKRYGEAADELELFLKQRPDARDADKIRQLIAQLREKAAAP
jgi:tetratricopeptide (TPR) repeat protein